MLAEMLLFFVPAVVAVVNYQDLLLQEGWRIGLVLVIRYHPGRSDGPGGGPPLPFRAVALPPESSSCLIPCSVCSASP